MNYEVERLLVVSLGTFVVAVLATGAMRWVARRRGWLAQPRKDRWHREPTALHGGVGFYPAFLFGASMVCFSSLGSSWQEWGSREAIPAGLLLAAALLFGSFVMFGLGLWDDCRHARPVTKLVGQLTAASLFILAGGIFSLTGVPLVDCLITYLWLVGITNAVNMLDNMDGLASGIGIIGCVTLALLALGVGDKAWTGTLGSPLSLLLAVALAGFLVFNRPPASIFMGDSGSLSTGFLLAGLAIPSDLNGSFGLLGKEFDGGRLLVLIIPATVLVVPLFDTILVTITRISRGQPIWQGGRDHASHRLVRLGFSPSTAVMLLYGCSALGGIFAVVLQQAPQRSSSLLWLFCLLLLIGGVYLGRVNIRDASDTRIAPDPALPTET